MATVETSTNKKHSTLITLEGAFQIAGDQVILDEIHCAFCCAAHYYFLMDNETTLLGSVQPNDR